MTLVIDVQMDKQMNVALELKKVLDIWILSLYEKKSWKGEAFKKRKTRCVVSDQILSAVNMH